MAITDQQIDDAIPPVGDQNPDPHAVQPNQILTNGLLKALRDESANLTEDLRAEVAKLSGGADADFALMPLLAGVAIIDIGNNANGTYIRFAGGVQVCFGSGTFEFAGQGNVVDCEWTFPAAFANDQYFVSGSLQSNQPNNFTRLITYSNATTTSCEFFAIAGILDNIAVSLFAIGAWA